MKLILVSNIEALTYKTIKQYIMDFRSYQLMYITSNFKMNFIEK